MPKWKAKNKHATYQKKIQKLKGNNFIIDENDVKSADDLGDLATDELMDIIGDKGMTRRDAEAMIMAIRETWFTDEEPVNDSGAEEEDKAVAEG